jgi:hypothetical protein
MLIFFSWWIWNRFEVGYKMLNSTTDKKVPPNKEWNFWTHGH